MREILVRLIKISLLKGKMREYINFKSILVAVLLLTPCSSLGDSLLEKKLEPKILNSTHYLEYNFSEYYKK